MSKTASDARPAAVRTAPAMTVSASESGTRQMDDTEFLLSSPENARRLRKAIAGLAAGKGVERELIECDRPSTLTHGQIISTGKKSTASASSASTR